MKIMDRYKSVQDLPTSTAVFPLRGCILLPHSGLPLNVFEPRYLQMMNDAIAGNRLLTIVQPNRAPLAANDDGDIEDPSDSERPESAHVGLRTTGCIGRITAFQELDDGRLIVSLSGIARCTLVSELVSAAPYRTFQLSTERFADDLVLSPNDQKVPREQLLATLKRFLQARNLKADWTSISRSATEQLVNSLSVMSPYGPEEKQALLEAATVQARAEMLIALAEMELASGGGPSGSTLQ